MTRSLDQQLFDAWHNRACRDVDAPWCRQPEGRRCLAEDGKTRIRPHPARVEPELEFDAGADSRQAEVDQRDAIISGHAEALRLITVERDDLRAEVRFLNGENTGLIEQVATLTRDLEATRTERDVAAKRYADHMAAAHPATPPPPSTSRMLVGAAVGGNGDPAPLEKALGAPLDLRRTYWSAAEAVQAARMAATDQAAGRTPFISLKAPHLWVDMAAGKGDAWAVDLAARINALAGKTWLAIHHEPEGDQPDMRAWVAMQQRLLPILRSPKIKVGIALTGYTQVSGGSPSFAASWPGDMAEFLAVDLYQRYGTTDAGLKWTPLVSHLAKVAAFAKSVGVPWGTAETGVTDEAMTKDPKAMADLFAAHRDNGAAFLAYFSSDLNSKGSWPLSGAKQAAFVAETRATS